MNSHKKKAKYLCPEFLKDQDDLEQKRMAKLKTLTSFDDMLNAKQASEQQEKDQQSNFDGKSQSALSTTNKGRDSFKFDADKTKDINDIDSITTPTGVNVPKLNMSNLKEKMHQRRNSSNSSKGSTARREKIRNALTGRTDGSEGPDGGGPQELPDEEKQDFMSFYDNDPFCRKTIAIVIEP